MALLGMLTMGVFVGSIACKGILFANNLDDWKKAVWTILSACFGGVVLTFMNRQLKPAGNAVYMYPVGLLLSYSWLHTRQLAEMVVGHADFGFWLGIAGIVGNVVSSIFAFVLVFPAAAKDVGSWKGNRNSPDKNRAG